NTKPEAFPEIVAHLGNQHIYRPLLAQTTFPKNLKEFVLRPRLQGLAIEGELMWSASVLSLFSTELKNYSALRDEFLSSYINGALDRAATCLDEIQEQHGFSIWLLGYRLQLLQLTKGLKAQK